MKARAAPRWRRLALRAAVFGPAAALLGLILHYSVDVPYWDDWGGQGVLLERLVAGDRDYHGIFLRQSLESREVVPRLLFVAVGLTLGWHVTVIMLLSWLCALAAFAAVLGLLVDPADRWRRVPLLTAMLAGALVFTPLQARNWLWSFQLMQFIPPACLAVSLRLAVRPGRIGRRVLVCAALSTAATFSAPNGMLCWPLALPIVPLLALWRTARPAARRSALGWSAVYLAFAVLVVSAFFWDYRKPPGSPPLDAVLRAPGFGLPLFAAWVGAPLVAGLPAVPAAAAPHLATGAGAALLAAAAWAAVQARKRASTAAAWPWLCLVGYGVGTGIATTIGRAANGFEGLMGARYFTHSLWVTIGLVGLLAACWQGDRRRSPRSSGAAWAVAVLAVLAVVSWGDGVARMQRHSAAARQNLLTLRLVDAVADNPLWTRLHPKQGSVRTARFLLEHGVLETDAIGHWLAARLQQPFAPAAATAGRFRAIAASETSLRVVGWAVLPERGVAADCVVLARQTPARGLEIVTGLVVERRRPADAEGLGEPGVAGAWFDDTFAFRSAEQTDLMVFAVDTETRTVHPLDHDHRGSKIVAYTFAYHLDTAVITELAGGAVARAERPYVIAGERRMVLVQHPDAEILFAAVPVHHGASLEFGAGVHESAWAEPGDGTLFEIDVRDGSTETTLFRRWIDPKNRAADRRWVDAQIDLAAYAGRTVDFRFRTAAGPAGDRRSDWAGWSRPQIVYRLRRIDGIASLAFVPDSLLLRDPMQRPRITLVGRFASGETTDLTNHVATRFWSSDPRVIEVTADGRLIAHRFGQAEIVGEDGAHRARLRVEADWPPVVEFGAGSPGLAGVVPRLEAVSRRAEVGQPFTLRASGIVGHALGALVAVDDPASRALNAGPPIAGPPIANLDGRAFPVQARGLQGAPGRGTVLLTVPIPADPRLEGSIVYWQGFFQDPAAVLRFSASNGLVVTIR